MENTTVGPLMTQDILHQPPGGYAPETWPLNDIYLTALDRQMAFFAQQGITWKWGLEVEFIPRMPAHYQRPDVFNAEDLNAGVPILKPAFDMAERILARPPTLIHLEANKLIAYVKKTPGFDAHLEQLGSSREKFIADIRSYKEALENRDPARAQLAYMNIFMAHLHTRTFAEGGMRDIIIPRLGSFTYGMGWWDSPSTAEVRLTPTADHRGFIADFHRMLNIINSASERFGLVPDMASGTGQLHFSLWDREGHNIMAISNQQDLDMAKRIMTGLYGLIDEAPHLINDYDARKPNYTVDLRAGPYKEKDTFRTASRDSWELRRGYRSNYMHLARDMAVIAAGARYGLYDIDDDADFRAEHGMHIHGHVMPVIEDRFKRPWNPFRTLLESCALSQDRHICPTDEIIRMGKNLAKALGKSFKDAYKIRFDENEAEADLQSWAVWDVMVREICIREDGTIDATALDPEIQAHFEPLRCVGKNIVIFGKPRDIIFGLESAHIELEKLHWSMGLNSLFTPEERESVFSFYQTQCVERARMAATSYAIRVKALLEAHTLLEEPPEKYHDVFRTIMDDIRIAAMYEEVVRYDIYNRDFPAPEGKAPTVISLAEYKDVSNPLKFLRPHFIEAAERQIAALRQNAQPNNYVISGLGAAADFMRDEIADPTHSHELFVKEYINTMWDTYRDTQSAMFILEAFSKHLDQQMNHATDVMLMEPGYDLDRAIEKIENCRGIAMAAMDELDAKFQKVDNVIKAPLKEAGGDDLAAKVNLHEDFRRSLRTMFTDCYDFQVKTIRAIPLTVTRPTPPQ